MTDKKNESLDYDRIRHLMKIGIIAALMVLAGDMILGWAVFDESLSGLEQYFARYLTVSDSRIFWSALLGTIGIPIETLCYFSVYRLIQSRSDKLAHQYRAGLIGLTAFGALVHVACCATIYHHNAIHALNPEASIDAALGFGKAYLLPSTLIFLIFFILVIYTQIKAFRSGMTPLPKWCWIFNIGFGFLIIMIMKLFGNHALTNAISTGWISVGSLWAYIGLLLNMKKAE